MKERYLTPIGADGSTRGEPPSAPSTGLVLTDEYIRDYLESLRKRGRSATTVSCYAAKLASLQGYLDGSPLYADTLSSWRSHLLESGYSPRTVNTYVSAANGLMGYLGRRDLQLVGQLAFEGEERTCLTRREYLSLLSHARKRGRERDYLLAKTLALLGISASELPRVSVEAAKCGMVALEEGSVPIPPSLAEEIISFASSEGMEGGPVFRGRDDRPLSRTAVSACLRGLAQDAGLAPERCGPGALASLRRTAFEEIRDSLNPLVRQAYESLLDAEQAIVGWDESLACRRRKGLDSPDAPSSLEHMTQRLSQVASGRTASTRSARQCQTVSEGETACRPHEACI